MKHDKIDRDFEKLITTNRKVGAEILGNRLLDRGIVSLFEISMVLKEITPELEST